MWYNIILGSKRNYCVWWWSDLPGDSKLMPIVTTVWTNPDCVVCVVCHEVLLNVFSKFPVSQDLLCLSLEATSAVLLSERRISKWLNSVWRFGGRAGERSANKNHQNRRHRRKEVCCWISQTIPFQIEISKGFDRSTERCKFVWAKLRESFCPAAASHSRPRQAGA